MLEVRLAERLGSPGVLAVPVRVGNPQTVRETGDRTPGVLAVPIAVLPDRVAEVTDAFLADTEHTGAAGTVQHLPQPGQRIARMLFVGVGDGSVADWRTAGAAIARNATTQPSAAVLLPSDVTPDAVAGLAEGLRLAAYRYRLANEPGQQAAGRGTTDSGITDSGTTEWDGDDREKLGIVTLVGSGSHGPAVERATAVTEVTCLARDLTNLSSAHKSPEDLANRLVRAAEQYGVRSRVWQPDELVADGFGGIVAVGGGSSRPPRLVELSWAPDGVTRHVVLVGKGITFDTGGVSIKPRESMLLMRKDMGGAATVAGAVLGAAALRLPVRVTVLAPLAENMVGADSYRPGDVVRHYGGTTTEVLNTDAEGRMVLADALAYAVSALRPDVVLDFATLTGAAMVGLGKRTAALLSDNDVLAKKLIEAGAAVGERMWRLPMPDDYREKLDSAVADLSNVPAGMDGAAATITAAMFLREFVGDYRDRWAHVDMSNASWSDKPDGELARYATGWGVRTLLRWLETSS